MADLSYLPIEFTAPTVDVPSVAVDTSGAPTSFDIGSLFPTFSSSAPASADFTMPSGGVPTPPVYQPSPVGPQGSYGFADQTGFAPQGPAPGYNEYGQPVAQPSQGVLSDLLSGKGLSSQDLTKLLLGGGAGLLGMYGQSQAQKQAAAAQKQIQDAYTKASQDYQASVAQQRQPASASLSEALQGKFDDASLRAFKAAESRLAQGASATGGVGAAQSTAALESARQAILGNQIKIAEEILSGTNPAIMDAINAELSGKTQALQYGVNMQNQINQASASLYQQLAKMLS
jgi:hypothetical protein